MFQYMQLTYMHACMLLDTLGRMPNTRGLRLRVFVHACMYHPQGVLDPEPSTTDHPNKHQACIVNTTPLRSVLSNNEGRGANKIRRRRDRRRGRR